MKGFINSASRWFGKGDATKKNEFQTDINRSSQTILVIDDSRTQVYATKKILEDFGFCVITAENGKTGIIKAKDEKPNLILMDIVMPLVNGFQATRYLTKHPETSHIPIIIVSSSTQEADKAWGLKLGACDFVTKPTDANLLITKVIRHLTASHQKRVDSIKESRHIA